MSTLRDHDVNAKTTLGKCKFTLLELLRGFSNYSPTHRRIIALKWLSRRYNFITVPQAAVAFYLRKVGRGNFGLFLHEQSLDNHIIIIYFSQKINHQRSASFCHKYKH